MLEYKKEIQILLLLSINLQSHHLLANSMDEAKELLQGHPHLEWAEGCEIEVHESLPLPGVE